MFRFSVVTRKFPAPPLPRVFDTHCHIGVRNHFLACDEDLAPIYLRAVSDGHVRGLTVVGIDLETSKQCKNIVERLRAIHHQQFPINDSESNKIHLGYSIGLHPHWADRFRDEFPQMKEMILSSVHETQKARVVAIGETGLDYFKSRSSIQDQKESLQLHLELASQTNLPVIIHCRNASRKNDRRAHDDLFDIIESFNDNSFASGKRKVRGVIHCFSDDVRSIERILKIGTFYASFCCTLGYPRNHDLRAACTACPLDAMVIETDSPYLPSACRRGEKNEPMFVQSALEYVVDCKFAQVATSSNEICWNDKRGEVKTMIADKLWKNSLDLFGY